MNAVVPAFARSPAEDRVSTAWMNCGCGDDRPLTLPVFAGGNAARAVLDSGATRIVVDAGFAARHGLNGAPSRRVVGLTGEVAGGLTGALDISVCDTPLIEARALILDLAPIARAARSPIDLVLGRDLFLRWAIAFDPDRECLRFLSNGSENTSNWLPVVQTPDGHFCTTIVLPDGTPAQALIDLGCMAPLYISPRFAEARSLFAGMKRGSSASVGIEGVSISELGRLPSLRLGAAKLRDIPFAVPARWNFAAPIILGLPVLRRFRCLLDFGKARMALTPAGTLESPFARDRSGLSVMPGDGRLDVIHVAGFSPAAKAGIVAGDTIVAINRQPLGAGMPAHHRGLGKQPPGTRYVLSLKGRGDRELMLDDYY